jgi:hypothetical protein
MVDVLVCEDYALQIGYLNGRLGEGRGDRIGLPRQAGVDQRRTLCGIQNERQIEEECLIIAYHWQRQDIHVVVELHTWLLSFMTGLIPIRQVAWSDRL